jgi:hypothetical protein
MNSKRRSKAGYALGTSCRDSVWFFPRAEAWRFPHRPRRPSMPREVLEHALRKSFRVQNDAMKSLCSSVRRFRDATIKEECKSDYPHVLQALWKALDRAEDLTTVISSSVHETALPRSGGRLFWMEKIPGGKIPYSIGMKDDSPFVFAGLWEGWKDPANGEMDSHLHNNHRRTQTSLCGRFILGCRSYCRKRITILGYPVRQGKRFCR